MQMVETGWKWLKAARSGFPDYRLVLENNLYNNLDLPSRVPARICWLAHAGKHPVCLSSVWRPKMRTVA